MFWSMVHRVLLWVVLLVVIGAVFWSVALAQDAPTEPPAGDIVPGEIPDELPPMIGEFITGVDEFLKRNETQILIGAVAFIVIAVARIILPDTKVNTIQVFTGVMFLFTGLYVVANLFGGEQWLSRGVEIGAIIARTIATVLGLLAVPSALYAAVGKGLKNPLVARPQGDRWWDLGEPEPEATLSETADDVYVAARDAIADFFATLGATDVQSPGQHTSPPHRGPQAVG